MAFDEQAAIDSFWAARARGVYFPPEWFDRLSLDQAYGIQLGQIARRCAAGEQQIGWKVGLTAPAIQQQFGFHEPVFGCILDSKPSGHVFGRDELIKPGFESELCLRVARPLSGEVSMAAARDAIDRVYPSLEIIETRGDFTAQIALALADNAQQKTVILGEPVALGGLALEAIDATVEINGSDRRDGTWRCGVGQSAEFGDLAGTKADRVRARHPGWRSDHERLVHAAVPDRAGRSDPGGLRWDWRCAGVDAGTVSRRQRGLVSTTSARARSSIGCSAPKRRSIFSAVDFATGVFWRSRANTFGSLRKARAAAASSG